MKMGIHIYLSQALQTNMIDQSGAKKGHFLSRPVKYLEE